MNNEESEPSSLILAIVLKNVEITDFPTHVGNQNMTGLVQTTVCTFTIIKYNIHCRDIKWEYERSLGVWIFLELFPPPKSICRNNYI